MEEDNYPPTNRTLENFFRGAWTYHIHNQVSAQLLKFVPETAELTVSQWRRQPEPSSWFAIAQHAHSVFFSGEEPNPYGEYWTGPAIPDYSISWEFV